MKSFSLLVAIAALLCCVYAPMYSQDIQYDTSEAKLKMGKELWKIQGTDGKLTMSLDGSKILVANASFGDAGGAFSVVDVATGTAKELKEVRYHDGGGSNFTTYAIDPTFSWLFGVTWYDKEPRQQRYFLYDLVGDSLISNVLIPGDAHLQVPLAVSKKYSLLLSSDGKLENPITKELVTTLPSKYNYGESFFDDAHGRIYWYSRGEKTVQEYDVASRAIREWYIPKAGVNAVKLIRSPNSPWLYVATLNDGNTSGNAVYAFNTETNQKVEFTQHAGGALPQEQIHMANGTIWLTSTGIGLQGYNRNTKNNLGQMAWQLSAETRTTSIMANPGANPFPFTFLGTRDSKEFVITPDFTRAIHCWYASGDSAILRCNELIPSVTSIEQTQANPAWFVQTPSSIEVLQTVDSPFVHIEIAATDGRIMLQRSVSQNEQRVIIPTQGFVVGSYVCTVRTAKQVLSTSFTILR